MTASLNANCLPCNLDGILRLPISSSLFTSALLEKPEEIQQCQSMSELPEGTSLLQSPNALYNSKFRSESCLHCLGMKIPPWLARSWLIFGEAVAKLRVTRTSGHWERPHLETGSFQKTYLILNLNFNIKTYSSLSPGLFTHFTLELPVSSLLPLDPGSLKWFKSRAIHTHRSKSWNSFDFQIQVVTGLNRKIICNNPLRWEMGQE